MDHASGLIRLKVRVPSVGAHAIERPRVTRALEHAAAGRRFLLVVASAGSGKTTAAVQLLAARGGPAAWLTLSDADDTPGRLVTYLAAAVADAAPGAATAVQRLLLDGLSPEDCAAVLAESLPGGTTVVVDDVHHVDERASVLRVLRAFLDAVPDDVLVVLLSRRLIHLDLSRHVLSGGVGAVSESELAFRAVEIDALLEARGLPGRGADLEASSGGWAAGIVFEALREGAPAVDAGGGDPFFAYLGSEVLDELPDRLRDAVLCSAVLDTVSPAGLAAVLGDGDATAIHDEIVRRHLPGVPEPDGLRYHPRFREFLLALLARERPDALRALRVRYARVLRAQGHAEEAARHLLDAGARGEAEEAVEEAVPALMRRGDWERVLAWCAALGDEVLARRPVLRGGQVRALLMSRRQEDVVALVEAMRATGEFARLASEAPDVAAWAVWSLHGDGDWPRVRALMPPPASCRRARVMAHILDVGIADDPAAGFTADELDRPWPLHVALQSAAYYRGAFGEVERLADAARARGPVTATLGDIYRVAVLRARGDLAEARAVLEGAAPRIRASRFIEFWQWAEAELRAAEGDHEGALHLIRTARQTSRHHRYPVADRAVFAVAEGRVLVRMERMPEAAEILERSREWSARRGLAAFREWAETWLAAARLGLGVDPAGPRALLHTAIGGMTRAGRRLELPAAWALLAEAEWRAGDEAAHDRAADAGYAAAEGMGTLGPLLDALDLVPDVLARRVDAAGAGDARWRILARRARTPAGRVSLEAAHVVVRTLGSPRIEVDGRAVAVSSPKAVELAAVLARAGARGVPRSRLAAELFPEGADAANALRQLLHRLRRALPGGAEVVTAEGRLAWLPADAVVAEDRVLEALIARARGQVGPERLETLGRALALAARGPYLPAADGEAARRRRDELGIAVAEARREYAAALLAAGRTADAREAAAAAVGEEPYREDAWRLLMRSEALLGGPASAVAAFLACRRALGEVGLDPSPETEVLLDRLRNANPADAAGDVTGA